MTPHPIPFIRFPHVQYCGATEQEKSSESYLCWRDRLPSTFAELYLKTRQYQWHCHRIMNHSSFASRYILKPWRPDGAFCLWILSAQKKALGKGKWKFGKWWTLCLSITFRTNQMFNWQFSQVAEGFLLVQHEICIWASVFKLLQHVATWESHFCPLLKF